MVGRQVDKVILFPLKRGSKCGKMDKKRSAGRRGFNTSAPGIFDKKHTRAGRALSLYVLFPML